MYFVYVLKSIKTGKYYKGLTNNIERRFKQHIERKVVSTKYQLPLKLIHVEICPNRLEARVLEKYLKSGYGREFIHEIDQ